MGIRIHKIVGWGTDQFSAGDDFSEQMEEFWSLSGKDFVKWLKAHKDEIKKLCAPKHEAMFEFHWECLLKDAVKENHISRCVSFDPEFGFENNIVISPIEMIDQCKRYDDLIDWLEEVEHCEPRWQWLTRGIYPYQKGEIPVSVVAVCLYLKIENLVQNLKEVLYVYWS